MTNGDSTDHKQLPMTAAAATPRSETPDDEDEIMGTPPEEGAEEEDELFTNIEKEEATQQAVVEQPKDVKAAPKLLQKALEAGQVQPSDSEQEEEKETEVKKPESPEGHVHPRVRILYFVSL